MIALVKGGAGPVIGSTQSLIRRSPEDGCGCVEKGKNARPLDDKKTLMLVTQIHHLSCI